MPTASSLIPKRKNIMTNSGPSKKGREPRTGPETPTKTTNTNSTMTSFACSSDRDPSITKEAEAAISERIHFLIQLHIYIRQQFSTKKQSGTTTSARIQHLLPFYHFLHHLHLSPTLPIQTQLLNSAF